MRLRILFLSLLFLFSISASYAETTPSEVDGGIRGKVFDKSNRQALEYATVMVYSQSDSAFVAGSISGKDGSFDIKLKPGKYYVVVKFIAYKPITIGNISIEKGKSVKELGQLFISPDTELLDEIEVVAERTSVEMSLDKRVVNIGKDLTAKTSNAIEVLENIPSVTVDVEGNVSLRGDDGVRILIDGKVSGLAGLSNRDALRAIQSDMIERIEIVTNPSVRYDAEGTSGIINIILKKDRRNGFNGSIDLTTGYPWQAGLGINANYRHNKVNYFANYNYNYRENQGTGSNYREVFATGLITDQTSIRERQNSGHTVRVGAEYAINPANTLTFSTMYRASRQNNTSTITYNDFSSPGLLIRQSERIEEQSGKQPNLQYGVDYRKQFAKKDQLLTASVQYFTNVDDASSNINERLIPLPNENFLFNPILQQTANNQKESNLQASVDYFHPFWGKAKLETGLKLQMRDVTNDYQVLDQDELGHMIVNNDFTNLFRYEEKILAGYAQFGNESGRFSYLLGLRAELSDIYTQLRETNEESHNNYPDFFPSAHLNYKLTENDQLQISYSRRIRRPGYWQLNPFRTFSDNRNIWSGNPDLKPVYTHSLEGGFLHFWKNANVNLNAYYRHSTDVFQRIERVNNEGISVSRPENFASNDSYGLELIGMASINKWFNINGNINLFRSITEGDAYDIHYKTDNYSWTSRLAGKFTILKGFDSQLAFNYMGKMNTPQGSRLPSWFLDLGFAKEVMKNKATLTLNIRDVFNTRGHGFETFGSNFYSKTKMKWGSTTVSLNFNYRINQQKKRGNDKQQQRQMDNEEGMMDF